MIDYLPPQENEYHKIIEYLYGIHKNSKQFTFQVTEDCCLACTYCYQHHKTKNKMTFDIAKQFIDKLLNNEFDFAQTNNLATIVFEFIGGEPLLEIDLINQITTYTIDTMIEKRHPWLPLFRVSICSNGVLYFDSKVQEFFKKFSRWISFAISIDGNKELHDSCRIDFSGNGSYDRAIAAMKTYRKDYGIQMSTKMTLAPENLNFLFPAVKNLINEGYTQIHLNCVFENVWHLKDATLLYYEMKKISNYLLNNNLYNKVNITLFNENLFRPMLPTDNENWCGGLSDKGGFAIDYKGNFYPCIRYMDSSLNGKQPAIIIGNIKIGLDRENENFKLSKNITRRSQSTDECFYCPIADGCAWCSAYNYEETGTPNKRTTYICIMHQARALANVYYWNSLYNKLNINKVFDNYLNIEKALQIIPYEEFNMLQNLIIERKEKNGK